QQRELERLRDQGEAEVEVEDVGRRRQPCERSELLREPHRQRASPIEAPVRLVVERPALEDDEPRVDPLAPKRLHVLPRDPGDVHRTMRDPKRHVLTPSQPWSDHGFEVGTGPFAGNSWPVERLWQFGNPGLTTGHGPPGRGPTGSCVELELVEIA